jgi:uncharacterized protein (DUF2141 family)
MPTPHRFAHACLIAAALAFGVPVSAEDAAPVDGTITVRVWNLQNDKGQIGCSLYSKKDGFPTDSTKADARMMVQPSGKKATCVFKGVKPGTYAVSMMHDENEDEELETNFVGRPQEWWGVSNDAPLERFGPPKYENATFKFDGKIKTLKIKAQL